MNIIKHQLIARSEKVEKWLSSCLDNRAIPIRLKDAMLYSLQAGGKRIRPVLCLACHSLCGGNEDDILPFAGAIEMIHTYSLIHDDLPAMDNDDLRRGKPSNHKAFDEATAILAGDGLLTDAFGTICITSVSSSLVLEALHDLALAAGSSGMVGGQELDMQFTGKKNLTIHDVRKMQLLKTGCLIEASCVCGAILAGNDCKKREAVSKYGKALGAAFQIADDILDITSTAEILGKNAHSDEKSGKNTFPSLLGLEQSKKLAMEQAAVAKNSLAQFTGKDKDFLTALADYVVQRTA